MHPEAEDEEEEESNKNKNTPNTKVGEKRKRKMSGYHVFQRDQQEVLRKTGEGKNFLAHCSSVWRSLSKEEQEVLFSFFFFFII